MNKPQNYEEAKQILINAEEDELTKHNKNVLKLRAGFVTAMGIVVAGALGLAVQDPVATAAFVPTVGLAGTLSLVPLFKYNKQLNAFKDGSFFSKNSEDTVIDLANRHVDDVNNYEQTQKSR